MSTRYRTSAGGIFTVYTETERDIFWQGMGEIETNVGRTFKTPAGATYKMVAETESPLTETYICNGTKKTFRAVNGRSYIEQVTVERWANKIQGK